MKAMALTQFGGSENFKIEDIAVPEPGPGQVLIRVKAAGIDPIDIKTRRGGGMAPYFCGDRPRILGWDVSGTVVGMGGGVHSFSDGDEVFGLVGFPGPGCSYAEFAVAQESELAYKPHNVSHAEAAAATLSPLTAWQALVEVGRIGKNDRVLIHGAAGGVGGFAVQIAKSRGCYVIATAAGTDRDFVKGLGADEVIDYRSQRFDEMVRGVDFVLDTIGGENFVRSLRVLKPDGTIVLLPSDKKEEAARAASEYRVRNFRHILVRSDGGDMRRIAQMLRNGSLRAHVDRIYPFEQIPQAHEQMENDKVRGKIAVSFE